MLAWAIIWSIRKGDQCSQRLVFIQLQALYFEFLLLLLVNLFNILCLFDLCDCFMFGNIYYLLDDDLLRNMYFFDYLYLSYGLNRYNSLFHTDSLNLNDDFNRYFNVDINWLLDYDLHRFLNILSPDNFNYSLGFDRSVNIDYLFNL